MLGIVFGVFSVIAMLAIGEGASMQAQKQVLELGATNIIVKSIKPPEETSQDSGSRVLRYGLKRSDLSLLDEISTVVQSTPIREATQEARVGARTMNIRVVGCTPEYESMNRLTLNRGRFLTDQDSSLRSNVVVIGDEAAQTLFPLEDPLGQTVSINKNPYQIIGVMKSKTSTAAVGGSLSGQDFNKDLYIPLETFRVLIGDLIIRASSGSFTAEEVELSQITLKIEDENEVMRTASVVRETLELTHTRQKDYDVVVPLELLKQAQQIRYIFNFVLGSIAAISLVVGGIGIMNIMLATVTERTREIGIRRALGAKRADIITQFLTETIVLSGTGGIIGIILGLATPYTFSAMKIAAKQFLTSGGGVGGSDLSSLFLEMQPTVAMWSLPLAFGISVGIGVVFGVYPAQSAARLDPIEALRHE